MARARARGIRCLDLHRLYEENASKAGARKAHILTGDRKGTWSLRVTRNWRLTFRIEDDEIIDMDLEDYH